MTDADYLAEAKRYAAMGKRAEDAAFGEVGFESVDMDELQKAATFFSAATAHATIAMVMRQKPAPLPWRPTQR